MKLKQKRSLLHLALFTIRLPNYFLQSDFQIKSCINYFFIELTILSYDYYFEILVKRDSERKLMMQSQYIDVSISISVHRPSNFIQLLNLCLSKCLEL